MINVFKCVVSNVILPIITGVTANAMFEHFHNKHQRNYADEVEDLYNSYQAGISNFTEALKNLDLQQR